MTPDEIERYRGRIKLELIALVVGAALLYGALLFALSWIV